MSFMRRLRAWLFSVFACAVIAAGLVVTEQARNGRWEHLWDNMLQMSLVFGAVFAVIVICIHVPLFVVLGMVLRQGLARVVAALVGILLAPVPYTAVAWRFGEFEDPLTLLAWMTTHVRDVLIAFVPFAIAGAAFGWLWMRAGTRCSTTRPQRAV